MKKRFSSLIAAIAIIFSFSGINSVFASTKELNYKEKLLDRDCVIEDTVKVTDAVPLNGYSLFNRTSASTYTKAKASVKLIKLMGNQWAVNAKSMARDQYNKPIAIDKIYVKGSLYYEENGELIYKIGEEKTEQNSADVMVEKVCGIDRRISLAKGYHKFEKKGFLDIFLETEDKR